MGAPKDIQGITVEFARIRTVTILPKIVPIQSLLIMEHLLIFVPLFKQEDSSKAKLEILVREYILLMMK